VIGKGHQGGKKAEAGGGKKVRGINGEHLTRSPTLKFSETEMVIIPGKNLPGQKAKHWRESRKRDGKSKSL